MSWRDVQDDSVWVIPVPWADAVLASTSSRGAYIYGGLGISLAMAAVLLFVSWWPGVGWTSVSPNGDRWLTIGGGVGIVATIVLMFSAMAFIEGMNRRTEDRLRLERLQKRVDDELKTLAPDNSRRRDHLHALLARGRGIAQDLPGGFDVDYWLQHSGPHGPRVLVIRGPIRWTNATHDEPPPITDLHEDADLGEITLSRQWLSWGAAILVFGGLWLTILASRGTSAYTPSCMVYTFLFIVPSIAASRWLMPLRMARIASVGRVTFTGLRGSLEFARSDSVLIVSCNASLLPTPETITLLRRDGRMVKVDFLDRHSIARKPEVLAALLVRWSAGRGTIGREQNSPIQHGA